MGRNPLLFALLLSGTLVRCECDEETVFEPRASYEPAGLVFGPTNVATEKRLQISVTNVGSAGLQILSLDANPSDKFTAEAAPDLLTALAPNATSSISVTYRPCPQAWNGNMLNPMFDLTTCPSAFDSGTLIITDNAGAAATTLSLSGQPVQPPSAEFACVASGTDGCNMPGAMRTRNCITLQFGDRIAGQEPCDLYVELINQNRTDPTTMASIPVAPLTIERAEIKIRDVAASGMPPIRNDQEAGFELLTEDGQPLTFPFQLAIPEGASEVSRLVRVRFTGQAGSWVGTVTDMLGLRIFTDDPDTPLRTIGIVASGTAPNIEVVPRLVDFGPVPQGLSRTATVSIRNAGNADLQITGAMLRQTNAEFVFAAEDGQPIARTLGTTSANDRFNVLVTYTPSDAAARDREFWDISSTDPDSPTFGLEVRGGPTPRFCFSPERGVLEFPIPNPPTGEARTLDVTLQSCGTGNLRVTSLDIQNAGNPESVDDFRIDLPGCSTLPCNPMVELCPEDTPGCTIGAAMPGISSLVPIVYQNNDTSTQDLANLVIQTDDPSLLETIITLDASDNPCLPPNVSMEVMPSRPCVPSPVILRVSGSPGGPIGNPSTLSNCSWRMIFGTTTVFTPPMGLAACTQTQFIPVSPGGLHLVQLTAENACGRSFTTPPEQINVAPNCN